ncbi:DUF1990 family protein [Microbacterium stercoris]|uniref:DUF1990 domain-containing protein n=1 Tax=Microbacterium stercoris TaxID=2820289 RepID=A0A939QS62_9MICO|nr:DUF1990 family protein [Microbacterium stercoris]MBO3664148.1 DUF1990 domain-containing protein [Microbacterium stercoris]
MRRGSFQDETVDYAAVGATQAHDLLQYPPKGSLPAADSWRIGSGEDRFRTAGDALLSWGALKGAGLRVYDVRPAQGPAYSGVSFDSEGKPIVPSRLEIDQRYDADGTPYAGPGTTLRVQGRVSGMRADGELRVIFVIEEARRIGFALGTVGGSMVSGEESFMIEWYDNDEVWFTVKAFDRPVGLLYRLSKAVVRRRRKALFAGYLRAISPLFQTPGS